MTDNMINCKGIKIFIIGFILGMVSMQIISIYTNKPDSEITDTYKVTEQETTVDVLDIDYLEQKLSLLSDLTTSEMAYTGIISVGEGSIPFITKKGFSMQYSSVVRAGIDVSLIEIEADEKTVYVTLPQPTIQTVQVDPETIVFFNEKHAIFNWTDKEDATSAILLAEQDLMSKAGEDNLEGKAYSQAKLVVYELLVDIIGNRKLVIR